jgi:hypothetical protein
MWTMVTCPARVQSDFAATFPPLQSKTGRRRSAVDPPREWNQLTFSKGAGAHLQQGPMSTFSGHCALRGRAELSSHSQLYAVQIFGLLMVFAGAALAEFLDEGAADAIKRADEWPSRWRGETLRSPLSRATSRRRRPISSPRPVGQSETDAPACDEHIPYIRFSLGLGFRVTANAYCSASNCAGRRMRTFR